MRTKEIKLWPFIQLHGRTEPASLWLILHSPSKFCKNPSSSFCVILQTGRELTKQQSKFQIKDNKWKSPITQSFQMKRSLSCMPPSALEKRSGNDCIASHTAILEPSRARIPPLCCLYSSVLEEE